MITSTHAANTAIADPRHTFLVPKEVFARYRWGRTRGYEKRHGCRM